MMTRSAICFVLALMLVADKAQGACVDDDAWAAKLVNKSNAKCSWFWAPPPGYQFNCSNTPELYQACPVTCEACNTDADAEDHDDHGEDQDEINHARMVRRCGKRKSEKKCRRTEGCKWDAETVPNCFAEVEDVCPGDSYLWRYSEETTNPSDGCTDEDGGECYSDATESCGEKSYECSGDPEYNYLWRYPEETDDKSDACTAEWGGECWSDDTEECYSASKLDKSCVGTSYLWRFPEETTDESGDEVACTVNEHGGECWNEDTSECEPVSAEVGASGTAKGCFKTWKAGYDGCNTAVTESDCKSLHESCAWLFNEPIKVFFDRFTRVHGCSGTDYLWRYPQETEDEDDACSAEWGGECWSDDTEECKPALTLFGKYAAEGKKWHAKEPLTKKEIKRFAREVKARFKLYKQDYDEQKQINKPTKQEKQVYFNIKRLYKAAKQSLAALKKAAQ